MGLKRCLSQREEPNTAKPKPKNDMEKETESETKEQGQAMNDVFSPDFESKADDFFTSKTKEKDHWQRRASIKLFGQWT